MAYTPALFLVAIFCLMMVCLGVYVSLGRRAAGVSVGDGGDEALRRRIRAHGNFAEYAPLAAVALVALGAAGASAGIGWGLALILVAGRVLHAVGMVSRSMPFLVLGMVLTHTGFAVSAVVLLSTLL